MMHGRIPRAASILVLSCLFAVSAVEATRVKRINLEEMTDRAGSIFAGHVVDVTRTFDPGLEREITIVTFDVERWVKGGTGTNFTMRTLAGDGERAGIADAPVFHPGDEVVLFLYGESDLGLTSPVGLGQGRFVVATDKSGRRVAINEFANRGLARNLTPEATSRLGATADLLQKEAGIDAGVLLDSVEALLSARP